jgi:hypothetical protein
MPMAQTAYDSEDVLRALLAKFPGLAGRRDLS